MFSKKLSWLEWNHQSLHRKENASYCEKKSLIRQLFIMQTLWYSSPYQFHGPAAESYIVTPLSDLYYVYEEEGEESMELSEL